MNTRIVTFLTLALVATAFAQTSVIRRLPARPLPSRPATAAQTNEIRRLPARPLPTRPAAAAQTNEPVQRVSLSRQLPVPRQASQSYVAPTAKSDDLVESPATNVVKSVFGYTLGAIWEGEIPRDAVAVAYKSVGSIRRENCSYGQEGEVVFPVKPKAAFEPFSSVTLSVDTNDSRIACIAAETPRMVLAESYAETCEKIGEIAAKVADGFGVKAFVTCHTNQVFPATGSNLTKHQSDNVLFGKLYRDYLKDHPTDSDFIFYKNISVLPFFRYTILPIAGSRYNERPIGLETARPDYLQQIWQPCDLSADYYPYTGEAVIRFSVRDVEDRTEHTNLVSVAQLKAEREKTAEKAANKPASRSTGTRILRRGPAQMTLSPEEQAFKDSLYRLSFAEAVEKSKENDPEALLRIALAYVDGKDIDRNYSEARKYLEKAAASNYGYAQYVHGLAESSKADWSRFRARCEDFKLSTDIYHVCSEDIALAVYCFEQAVSNGVSFAKEDLQRAKVQVKAKEDAAETQRRNEEVKQRNEAMLKAAKNMTMPTNDILAICGIRLGEANDKLVSKYESKGTRKSYKIRKDGKMVSFSCMSCSFWWPHGSDREWLFNIVFYKNIDLSISSHKVYAVKLSSDQDDFEAKEGDLLASRPLQLSDQIAEVLKTKYGEPETAHNGDNKCGERKWYFEKDGLFITLEVNYRSNDPNTEQAQKGLRTYYATTTLQYIHLPTLEAAIEEGREFSARPLETDGESAKRAAERL